MCRPGERRNPVHRRERWWTRCTPSEAAKAEALRTGPEPFLRNEANFPGAGEAEPRARKPVRKLLEILAGLRGRPSDCLSLPPAIFQQLIIGSFAGYLIGAWLADRIGRRNLFLIFSIGVIAIVLIYTQLKLPNRALWVLSVSARLFCLRLFLRHGCLPDRIISDTVAPLRPRFLL